MFNPAYVGVVLVGLLHGLEPGHGWVLMLSYGLSVLLGLIVVTIGCVRIYKHLQPKLVHYERYIPKVSAAILVAMAIVIIFW